MYDDYYGYDDYGYDYGYGYDDDYDYGYDYDCGYDDGYGYDDDDDDVEQRISSRWKYCLLNTACTNTISYVSMTYRNSGGGNQT